MISTNNLKNLETNYNFSISYDQIQPSKSSDLKRKMDNLNLHIQSVCMYTPDSIFKLEKCKVYTTCLISDSINSAERRYYQLILRKVWSEFFRKL